MVDNLNFNIDQPDHIPQLEKSPLSRSANGNNDDLSSLLEEILLQKVRLQLKVTGQSMYPAIQNGDIVYIERVDHSQIHFGDLIFFKNHKASLVLHRLLRKKVPLLNDHFQTKGDSLSYMDAPTPVTSVLGRVTMVQRSVNSKLTTHDMCSLRFRIGNRIIGLLQVFHILTEKMRRLLLLKTKSGK